MGTRLDYSRLETEYPDRGKQLYRKLLTPYKALLQKNYGLKQDCTLTCLACIFGEGHYGAIERIAIRHGYNGETYGTHFWTIRAIMAEFLRTWGMAGSARAAYGKGLGWRWSTVKNLIAQRSAPVVLNLYRDGRDYYSTHSVTVVGVEEYERARFLLVYDNWSEGLSLVDYDKLSIISSINWVKK